MPSTPLKRLIWIVDDSPTDSSRAAKVLGSEFNVETFTDGSSAIERLGTATSPDLLLIDWMMPGISGIEVAQFIRSSAGPIARLPIILLTSHHGASEIVEAFASGANDYISKPFVDQELQVRVRTLIETTTLLARAEKAESEVRSLLTNAPDPIFAITGGGIVSFANSQALLAIGMTADEILGKPLNSILPDLNLSLIQNATLETDNVSTDLTIGDRLFSPSLGTMPSDSLQSTTVSLRDVTDRRNAEARRLDFYSIIAHDLRTPITSALMRLQFALRGKHGVLPGGLVTDLQKMEGSLRTQVAMVNDFLELAKLEGNGYRVEVTPLDMSDLIIQTMDEFQPLLDKHSQKWIHVNPHDKVFALGDVQRISQVLANLIGNAVKFTPTSGTITTRIEVLDNEVVTSIEDTGRGIAAHEISSLFDRFTRAKESANEVTGSGLGLMIVREIVSAHRGTVGVRSELSKGSCFWFKLPKCNPL